jgi:hypothetical protein
MATFTTYLAEYVDRADLEELLNKEYRKWDNEGKKWIFYYHIEVRLSHTVISQL